MKKAIIIGGGPAGLTAALEFLRETDVVPIVLEQSNYWGGISRTVRYKGNRMDIGGHRFFSKSEEIMKWWNQILPVVSENEKASVSYRNQKITVGSLDKKEVLDSNKVMLVRKRKSRIFYKKTFFDYPISLSPQTIKKLGYGNTLKIGISYLKRVIFPIKNEKNLEEFFINRFGNRLYKTFFKDYTEKVWGKQCVEISAEWGVQRIKGLSIRKALSHYFGSLIKSNVSKDVSQKNVETSLIEYFLYPKYGPGQMWEEVAALVEVKGGTLMQNVKVVSIDVEEEEIKSITYKNQLTKELVKLEGDIFISTMPIKELVQSLRCEIPPNIREIATGLQYRDFITVGLLLNQLKINGVTDNWIYIQEPYVKVGRLQIFNNWSPFLVEQEDKVWVGLEYFCNEDDELWNLSDYELKELAAAEMVSLGFIDIENVLDSTVIRVPKTYPAYFGTYDRFDLLKEFLNKFENLFLIGRNGMHKYNNQDHSMLTAIRAVQNVKNNIKYKENLWEINTEQEYHEERKK